VTANAAVRGVVEVPGSKSGTNRALVLSALADGPSTVTGALESRDCDLMVDALRALGVNIEASGPGELRIMPPQRFRGAPGGIDCGLAGTVMRFVPPLVALADSPTRFYGDPQATTRPMSGLLDGLRKLGARIDADSLPFTLVPGPMTSDSEVVMDSSASSQFVSGLLLIGARLPSGLRLRHAGDSLPSRPHIAMTVEMLRARGVRIDEPDARSWRVHSGPVLPLDVRVEPDLTNASVYEYNIKKEVISRSRKRFLMADHSKFGKTALYTFCDFENLDAVITDMPPGAPPRHDRGQRDDGWETAKRGKGVGRAVGIAVDAVARVGADVVFAIGLEAGALSREGARAGADLHVGRVGEGRIRQGAPAEAALLDRRIAG